MDVVRSPVHRFQRGSINSVLTSSVIARGSILLGKAWQLASVCDWHSSGGCKAYHSIDS